MSGEPEQGGGDGGVPEEDEEEEDSGSESPPPSDSGTATPGNIVGAAEATMDLDQLFVEDEIERVGDNSPSIVIADIELQGVTDFTIAGEGRESQYLRENETGTGGEAAESYGATSPPPSDGEDSGGTEGDDSADEPPLNITIDAFMGHRTASQLVALRGLDATFDVLVGDLVLEDMEMHDFERRLTGDSPFAYEAHIEVQEWREYEVPGIDDYAGSGDGPGAQASNVTPLPGDLPEWADSGEPGDPNVIELEEGQVETYSASGERVSNVIFDQSAEGASATLDVSGQWRIEHVAFTGEVNTEPNIVTTGSGYVQTVFLEYGGIHHERPDQVIHNNVTILDSQQGALAPDAGFSATVGTTPSEEVPSGAEDIRAAHPEVQSEYNTTSAGDYDGRSGDLSELIRSASNNDNAIVDLGGGTYEIDSEVSGSFGSVVGVVGNNATIYYNGDHLDTFFEVDGSADVVMEGFTLDITEDSPANMGIADIALANINTSGDVWSRNVTVRGKRRRWQSGSNYGGLYNFNINLTSSSAVGHHYNIQFPDGLEYGESSNRPAHHSQGIAFSADPPHNGTNVFEQCSAQNWAGNIYYIQNSPGVNYLLDCHARNGAAGQFRPGGNDIVIGGFSEAYEDQGPGLGVSQLVCADGDVEVYDLEIESEYHMSDAIQVRSSIENLLLDGVTVNANHHNRVVRLSRDPSESGRVNVTLRNCFFYDGYTGSSGRPCMLIRDADVTVEGDFAITSEANPEVEIRRGSLTIGDDTHRDGTYSNSDLGVPGVSENSLPTGD